MKIRYINRETKQEEFEKVYGRVFLQTLYGQGLFSLLLSVTILPLVARIPFFSWAYGVFQKSKYSRGKVRPFIQEYQIDTSEFQDDPESFESFNDFFIRKLKPESRPITTGNDVAVLPADGRYLVFSDLAKTDGFLVKGKKFSLQELLNSEELAAKYKHGEMVIARLCPVDYHRFHFPCTCMPGEPKLINGPLFSVNPIALKKNIDILSENKRVITELQTKHFGTVLYIEVGATNVGSIEQTFTPQEHYAKGDEKGYFEFGGSCLIILFEPQRIQFDQDLLDASHRHMEVLGKMGQSLGRSLNF
jgi:phosphatidylserine decarboxylase